MREAILAEHVPIVAVCCFDRAREHLTEIDEFKRSGITTIWRDMSPTVDKALEAEAADVDMLLPQLPPHQYARHRVADH